MNTNSRGENRAHARVAPDYFGATVSNVAFPTPLATDWEFRKCPLVSRRCSCKACTSKFHEAQRRYLDVRGEPDTPVDPAPPLKRWFEASSRTTSPLRAVEPRQHFDLVPACEAIVAVDLRRSSDVYALDHGRTVRVVQVYELQHWNRMGGDRATDLWRRGCAARARVRCHPRQGSAGRSSGRSRDRGAPSRPEFACSPSPRSLGPS
jgi:hypothetical protein